MLPGSLPLEVVEVATGGTELVCKHPWAHGSCGHAGGHHGGGRSPACPRAAAILELSEVADSTSALSECFKVFLSIE